MFATSTAPSNFSANYSLLSLPRRNCGHLCHIASLFDGMRAILCAVVQLLNFRTGIGDVLSVLLTHYKLYPNDDDNRRFMIVRTRFITHRPA